MQEAQMTGRFEVPSAGGVPRGRRAFLESAARWGVVGALAVVGAITVRRGGGRFCGVTSPCAACARYSACDLPPASQARAAEKP